MAGYNGWSMSNNAVDAYENGEMPLSKWDKKAILDAIDYDDLELKCSLEKIRALPLKILKAQFLEYTSWHHTSKFYNCTDFYSLNIDYIKDLTDDDIDILVENHKEDLARKRAKKKQEIESKKVDADADTENVAEKSDDSSVSNEEHKPHLKYYKEFPKEYIGDSDIAALLFAGLSENGLISQWVQFGGDSSYDAYIVDEEAEIGAHYSFIVEFKHWLIIYDDLSLSRTFYAEKIKVYRAGNYGCIIQLINPCKDL